MYLGNATLTILIHTHLEKQTAQVRIRLVSFEDSLTTSLLKQLSSDRS